MFYPPWHHPFLWTATTRTPNWWIYIRSDSLPSPCSSLNQEASFTFTNLLSSFLLSPCKTFLQIKTNEQTKNSTDFTTLARLAPTCTFQAHLTIFSSLSFYLSHTAFLVSQDLWWHRAFEHVAFLLLIILLIQIAHTEWAFTLFQVHTKVLIMNCVI